MGFCSGGYLLLALWKDSVLFFFFPSGITNISFCWCFLFIILWRSWFVERYWVNLVLSWNTLVSPSMLIESLVGYHSLGWHFCSLSVCITSVQVHLAFIVSGEKSSVILIGLPLYVIGPFSLTDFKILSLFCALDVLTIMWWEDFFFLFQSTWISVAFLYVYVHLFLFF